MYSFNTYLMCIILKGKDRTVNKTDNTPVLKKNTGTSVVAQWLRICLRMQGTQIRALVW